MVVSTILQVRKATFGFTGFSTAWTMHSIIYRYLYFSSKLISYASSALSKSTSKFSFICTNLAHSSSNLASNYLSAVLERTFEPRYFLLCELISKFCVFIGKRLLFNDIFVKVSMFKPS